MTIYHKHHIIPKHMGGTDDPSNLVRLTIEEHAEAHRKLFEEHGRWQDKLAWKSLSGQITFAEAARLARIESNKRRRGSILSEDHKRKLSEATKGRPKSEETRRKMSETQKINGGNGPKIHSIESKNKMSVAHKGKKQNEEWIKNRSVALIGRVGGFDGKSHSEETKTKMREAAKKRWANRKCQKI